MGKFKCKRCGKCCALAIPVTEQDLLRWAIARRDDLLDYVSPRDRFIRQEDGRCPFLALSPRGLATCRIYRIRPEACARFPLSTEQAKRMGCAGLQDGCANAPSCIE